MSFETLEACVYKLTQIVFELCLLILCLQMAMATSLGQATVAIALRLRVVDTSTEALVELDSCQVAPRLTSRLAEAIALLMNTRLAPAYYQLSKEGEHLVEVEKHEAAVADIVKKLSVDVC